MCFIYEHYIRPHEVQASLLLVLSGVRSVIRQAFHLRLPGSCWPRPRDGAGVGALRSPGQAGPGPPPRDFSHGPWGHLENTHSYEEGSTWHSPPTSNL